jgi:hypothetical protein
MKNRLRGNAGKFTLLVIASAMFASLFAIPAQANNLDARTAINYARDIARKDCKNTRGCTDYKVIGLRKRAAHKAVGKIGIAGARDGVGFVCTRQLVIKLDHFTGNLDYAVSRRRCDVG